MTSTTTIPEVTVTTTTTNPRVELVRYAEEELDESKYTPESWAIYKEVLERAKMVLGAGDENEIKAVLEELIAARKMLVLGASDSVNTGVGTEVSVSAFAVLTIAGAVALLKRKRND